MATVQLLSRESVTQKILHQKVVLDRKWADLATQLNRSLEWTVTACLGQMQFTHEQAICVGEFFELTEEERKWLETVPYRNASQSSVAVPSSDPLLYRLYEVTIVSQTRHDIFHSIEFIIMKFSHHPTQFHR